MSENLLDMSGGCYCGGVRFRAKGVKPQVTECHCSQCRKQSGHRLVGQAHHSEAICESTQMAKTLKDRYGRSSSSTKGR